MVTIYKSSDISPATSDDFIDIDDIIKKLRSVKKARKAAGVQDFSLIPRTAATNISNFLIPQRLEPQAPDRERVAPAAVYPEGLQPVPSGAATVSPTTGGIAALAPAAPVYGWPQPKVQPATEVAPTVAAEAAPSHPVYDFTVKPPSPEAVQPAKSQATGIVGIVPGGEDMARPEGPVGPMPPAPPPEPSAYASSFGADQGSYGALYPGDQLIQPRQLGPQQGPPIPPQQSLPPDRPMPGGPVVVGSGPQQGPPASAGQGAFPGILSLIKPGGDERATIVPKSDATQALIGGAGPDRPMPGTTPGLDAPDPNANYGPNGGGAFGRVFPPTAGALAGQPMGELNWNQTYPAYPGGQPIISQMAGASTVPYELQANTLYGGVDTTAAPRPYGAHTAEVEPPVPDATAPGTEPAKPGETKAGPEEPKPAPTAPGEGTPVAAGGGAGGGAGGAATAGGDLGLGSTDLNANIAALKELFPKLDITNPQQDRLDAYMARENERTAAIAQLAMASGMIASAGKSWEPGAQGVMGAANVYGKGFDRYQTALKDAADRYQKQKETQQQYDIGLTEAGLKLYTTAWTELRTDAREARKAANENINKYFDSQMEVLKSQASSGIISQDQIDKDLERINTQRKLSLDSGRIINKYGGNVSDTAQAAAP